MPCIMAFTSQCLLYCKPKSKLHFFQNLCCKSPAEALYAQHQTLADFVFLNNDFCNFYFLLLLLLT